MPEPGTAAPAAPAEPEAVALKQRAFDRAARGPLHGVRVLDLSRVVAEGGRAVMLYVVQRTDCARLRLAADLDPAYAAAFARARAAGVEAIAHATYIGRDGVTLGPALPMA